MFFPGCFNLNNDISVVGTEACFSSIWLQVIQILVTMTSPLKLINVLTNNGTENVYVNGTSFAAPMVTATVAQTSHSLSKIFNATEIKKPCIGKH